MKNTNSSQSDYKSYLKKIYDTLEECMVKKAPSLPRNIKEIIVNFGPWITLILMVMMLPAVLFFLGIGTIALPFTFMGGVSAGTTFSFTMVFSVVTLVLSALALPGLFKKQVAGWNYLYYAALLGVIQNIISFNLGGLIIGSLLNFYILFQIREYYK